MSTKIEFEYEGKVKSFTWVRDLETFGGLSILSEWSSDDGLYLHKFGGEEDIYEDDSPVYHTVYTGLMVPVTKPLVDAFLEGILCMAWLLSSSGTGFLFTTRYGRAIPEPRRGTAKMVDMHEQSKLPLRKGYVPHESVYHDPKLRPTNDR